MGEAKDLFRRTGTHRSFGGEAGLNSCIEIVQAGAIPCDCCAFLARV
jgi:hypothetical protein